MSGRLISWVILWWNFMVESFYDFPLGLLMISIVFPSGKIRKKTSEKSMVSPCFPRNHWGKKKFTTPLKMPQLEMCSNAMLATLVWLVKPWKTSTFFINDVFFSHKPSESGFTSWAVLMFTTWLPAHYVLVAGTAGTFALILGLPCAV